MYLQRVNWCLQAASSLYRHIPASVALGLEYLQQVSIVLLQWIPLRRDGQEGSLTVSAA